VLTKVDKISKDTLTKLVKQVEQSGKRHTALFPTVMATSSETKEGIESLRIELAQFVTFGTKEGEV
jgi:GTP-binding protein